MSEPFMVSPSNPPVVSLSNPYRHARVLVTGGLGFIGSNLSIALVRQGAVVTIVDSMIPHHGGNLFNIEPVRTKVHVNFSDIRDGYSLRHLVKGQDVIFNLAGQVSHIDSMEDPMTDLEINCRAQLTLLEACRAHNPSARIVFAGTRQIYGKPASLPVDETHLLEPVDVNGINKMAGEWYHLLYARVYGMKCTALRMTNTYGPRQRIEGVKHGFVGIFLCSALLGERIRIHGDGSQLRDFNYVDDVVEALLIAGLPAGGGAGMNDALSGDRFNLGHHRHYSLLDFVTILREFCNFDYELVPLPEERRRIDIGDYYSSYEKFKRATGWTPKVDLREGLRKTVAYYRAHGSHYLDVGSLLHPPARVPAA